MEIIPTSGPAKIFRIGLFQLADNGLLNITRDSFLEEMKRLGYEEGRNCRIFVENANGDLAAVNSILDKFLMEGVDIIVPISTACTQTAVSRVKDRPVVFATVANPFIIQAGSSDTDHLPNVTGVYGWAPMDEMLKMVSRLVPGKIRIGAIWDQAQSNSVFNVENLRKAAEKEGDVQFVGANIANSSEVYEAALGLVNKGIDAFVLSPDNIVYSAFESVVKAAGSKKIPIAVSDVECLSKGALLAYGYDYAISGVQAAQLVDRILKGERSRRGSLSSGTGRSPSGSMQPSPIAWGFPFRKRSWPRPRRSSAGRSPALRLRSTRAGRPETRNTPCSKRREEGCPLQVQRQ